VQNPEILFRVLVLVIAAAWVSPPVLALADATPSSDVATESMTEIQLENGAFNIDLRKHFLVVAGNSSELMQREARELAEIAMTALKDPNRFARQNDLNDLGVKEVGLRAGDSNSIYGHPMSTAKTPLDPNAIAAIAFCAGGERGPQMGSYDGIAGAEERVSVGVDGFREELMAGLRGSAGTALTISEFFSTPYGTLADAINGWFVSDRFGVRVFKIPSSDASDLEMRAQAQQSFFDAEVIGW
jgi:hypothetical protein